MFLLEPMVARMLLPQLGGAPSVWNGCVLFFQFCLLTGYAGAHGTRRLGLVAQSGIYGAILVLSLGVLPVAIPTGGPISAEVAPTIWLLTTLTTAIGAPFFALAVCAPCLQRWFSETSHNAARDPYFLYAASNSGSLMGLAAYPILIEPLLSLGRQSRLWTAGFGVFTAAVALCALTAWRLRSMVTAAPPAERPMRRAHVVGWRQRLRWTLLAAIPSSLMLGVTSYLTTDIAAVPLLWVGPLAIYLMSFVLAFSTKSTFWTSAARRRLPLLVAALAAIMAGNVGGPLWLVVPLHLMAFACAAQACHGQLASERPDASALTEYYLWLAVGGTVGGAFNTFVAPSLFDAVIEYPMALVLAAAVGSARSGSPRPARTVAPYAIAVLTAGLVFAVERSGNQRLLLPAIGVPTVVAFSLARQPVLFATAIGAMLAGAALVSNPYGHVLETDRTFFGVYRVTEDRERSLRSLYHGTTLHGVQAIDGPDRSEPLTYYHRGGPFGQAFVALSAMSEAPEVAAVGLGVGSLAAYAGPHQRWTFYEIDPAVERIARTTNYFTFLEECRHRCRVVLGDARLSLAASAEAQYGVLVVDAFSSDAIPVHLITREAMALYLNGLETDGVLAFHISNRHLDLAPVLSALAADAGLAGAEQSHEVSVDEAASGRNSSRWVVMARDPQILEPLLRDQRWAPLAQPSVSLWTDDFSNLLSAFRF